MAKNFRFSFSNLAFNYLYFLFLLVFLSSFFSFYLHYTNITEPIKSIVATQEIPRAVDQILIFLIAVIASTFIVLLILIKKYYFLLRVIYISVFSLASFIFISLFLQPLQARLSLFSENLAFQISLLLNFFLSVFLIYGIFYSKNNVVQNHSLLILSCIMGSIIGEVLQLIQLIILLLIFAIYDMVAVFLGPLKRIAKELENIEQNVQRNGGELFTRGMFMNLLNIEIGVGDLLLYSATAANLSLLGAIGIIYSIIAIIIGSAITILLARKFKVFPGLPIPAFLTIFLVLFF